MFQVDVSKLSLHAPSQETMQEWHLSEETSTLPGRLIIRWHPELCVLNKVNITPTPALSEEIRDFILEELPEDHVLTPEVGRILFRAGIITLSSEVNIMDIHTVLTRSLFWNTIGKIRIGSCYTLSPSELWLINKMKSSRYGPVVCKIPIDELEDSNVEDLEIAHRSAWITLGKESGVDEFVDLFMNIMRSGKLVDYSHMLQQFDTYYHKFYDVQDLAAVMDWFDTYGMTPTLDLAILAHDSSKILSALVDAVKSIDE